jgi:hypothetical protein
MPATIIRFPETIKKQEFKVQKSFELIAAWHPKFFNPYLNAIYSETVPYLERWYLETRHCLAKETPNNLLGQLIQDKQYCKEFIDACESDLKMCKEYLNDDEYSIMAEYWIKKLRRWQSNFLACYNHTIS